MKKFTLLAATAAMALTAGVATAQPYGAAYGYHRNHDGYARDSRAWRDSDRDGRSDAQEWNRDRDHDGRPDQYDRYDNRRSGYEQQRYSSSYGYGQSAYGYGGGYRQGQRYPYYNQRQYVIEDYRSYNLPPPRYGYRYYRGDNGDVLSVAIASGLIAMIINGDNQRDGYYRR
jgi:Ni/Co efflux regulator RcnB